MEIKDVLYILGGLVAVIGSYFKLNSDIDLVKNDLKNHKDNHNRLEDRLTTHEYKFDEKLDVMNGKIDELKDLIIDRMK